MSGVALRQKIPPAAPDVGDLLKSIAAPKAEEESANEAPCQLVLHNDDYNSFGFVAAVLGAVLGYGFMKCLYLAIRVHVEGKRAIWTGGRRQAEARARRIRDTGPDPHGAPRLAPRPLLVTVEPA